MVRDIGPEPGADVLRDFLEGLLVTDDPLYQSIERDTTWA